MRQVQVIPFLPNGSNTVSLSATVTSGNVALTAPNTPLNPELPGTCRVVNLGPDTVFIKFGIGSAITATTGDIPVPAGNTEVFWVPAPDTYAAAICPTSTATVYFTPGQGS